LSEDYFKRVTYDSPQTLIWSQDGQSLVATYREAEKTRLTWLYSADDDRPQIFVDEQITDLAWLTDDRLLAITQLVELDGDNLSITANLLIWNGQWDVERIELYRKNYFRPDIVGETNIVHRFDLSPLKDELLYNRYLDPQLNNGRVELVLFNLHTGREIVLAVTDARQIEGFLAADAEAILLPDGRGQVQVYNPWTREVKYRWNALGENLQAASGKELYFIDGKLFSNDQLQLSLPYSSKGAFSDDGSHLFVAWQRKLYLFDNYLAPEAIQFSELEKLKLQRIRLQRSRGEISIRRYYWEKNKILNP
jgi:hypothetical protein